ncbi:MAG TPA: hypothetical protein VFI87_12035 [Hyphomicrobiaceae bacterium]|nr:hypothetical protein [Hyphomicrobiaceae bacterium]
MASLYIAEFSSLASAGGGGSVQAAQWPPLREQKIALSGTSAASAAFGPGTTVIRVHSDVVCSIKVGGTPVATAANARLAADATEYFGVESGAKIAGITNT